MDHILETINNNIILKESIFLEAFNESESSNDDENISKNIIKEVLLRRRFFNYNPEDTDDFRYEKYKNLDDDVDLIYSVLNNIKFPARLFRGLRIPQGKELQLENNVGKHWTTNWSIFERDGIYGFEKPDVILSGLVSKDMVNWPQTIEDRYSDIYSKPNTREYEVELKNEAIPDDITIESDFRNIYD